MSALRAWIAIAGALALAAAAASGCAGDEGALSPRASDGTTSGGIADAGPDDAPSDAPTDAPPGTPKRTVKTVNPYGVAGNLFVDGDFEWSVARDDDIEQYGFLGFDNTGAGAVPIHAETGGLCRSGLHCAVLKPKMLMFARATAAPAGKSHFARVYAKPSGGAACGAITMLMVTCDTFLTAKKLNVADEADAGWCRYEGTITPRDAALCLVVESTLKADQSALVDGASLVPDDGSAMSTKSLDTWKPSAEEVKRLATLRDTLHRRMLLDRPGPKGPPRPMREP